MKILVFMLIPFLLWINSLHATEVPEAGFQVVVNPRNPVDTIEQKELAAFFLKKKTYWPDQSTVLAVDLEASSNVRRQFSEKILDRPVSAVRNYWQQLLFSGRGVPPPEFRSEQDVLSFVSAHQDAIGYVSGNASIGDLKAVKIK